MKLNSSDFWGIDEPLRFPVGASGWEDLHTPQPLHPLELYHGRNKLALVLTPRTAAETMRLVALLTQTFHAEFDAAAEVIAPEGWRQLYYRGTYVLDCLMTPHFNAELELWEICAHHALFMDAPAEWLGTNQPLEAVAEETMLAIREAGPDIASAIWAVLAGVQHVPLTKAEILHCQWWTPAWLKALSRQLNP